MCKDVNIKHYDVRIPCKTKAHANNVILALVWSGYNAYMSCDTFDGSTVTFDVCYNAQPDEVTLVKED